MVNIKKTIESKIENMLKLKTRFVPIFIFAFVFIFSLRGIYGEDIYFHLSTGRYILENKDVPATDVFSYTAEGKTWINQNWFSDIVFYSIHKNFGNIGLGLFFALQITSIYLILYSILKGLQKASVKEKILIPLTIAFLAAFFSIARFQARPETGSYLFIVTLIWLLTTRLENIRHKVILKFAGLTLLFLIWANWQAGFVPFGIAILCAWVVFRFVKYYLSARLGKEEKSNKKDVFKLLLFLLTPLICLINPTGIKGILYFTGVGPSFLKSDFTEWGSIGRILNENAGDLDFKFLLIGFILFFVFFGIQMLWKIIFRLLNSETLLEFGLIFSDNSWVIILSPFVFLPFFAYRFIPLAIITLSLLIVYTGIDLLRLWQSAYFRWGMIICFFSLSFVRLHFYKPVINAYDNKIPFREEAIKYIRDNNLKGNIFNPLEDGGYLIWRMPEKKVFIDQRLDVFTSSGIYDEYKIVYSHPPGDGWSDVLDKYAVEIVLLPGWQEEPMKTIRDSGKYDLVYWSDYFFILVRNSRDNFEYARNNKISEFIPFKKDDYDQRIIAYAIEDAKRLEDRSPLSANPLVSEGLMYQQIKDTTKAIDAYKKALDINPHDNTARLYLASLYVEDKACRPAIGQYQEVEKRSSGTVKAIAFLNSAYVYKDCLSDLRASYKYFAKFVTLARSVGYDPKAVEEAYLNMQVISQMMK